MSSTVDAVAGRRFSRNFLGAIATRRLQLGEIAQRRRSAQLRGHRRYHQGNRERTRVGTSHTQVAKWLRSTDASNPFHGGVIASQTPLCMGLLPDRRLPVHLHQRDPAARRRERRQASFDGYIVGMLNGPSPINQCAERIPAGDPRRPIRNAGVPVIHVMSQSDYLGWAPSRREDSDAPGSQYRHYDIAGAGHATPDELWFAASSEDIMKGGRTPPALNCDQGPRSRFPSWVAYNAIYRNLKAWVEDGVPPPPPSQEYRGR